MDCPFLASTFLRRQKLLLPRSAAYGVFDTLGETKSTILALPTYVLIPLDPETLLGVVGQSGANASPTLYLIDTPTGKVKKSRKLEVVAGVGFLSSAAVVGSRRPELSKTPSSGAVSSEGWIYVSGTRLSRVKKDLDGKEEKLRDFDARITTFGLVAVGDRCVEIGSSTSPRTEGTGVAVYIWKNKTLERTIETSLRDQDYGYQEEAMEDLKFKALGSEELIILSTKGKKFLRINVRTGIVREVRAGIGKVRDIDAFSPNSVVVMSLVGHKDNLMAYFPRWSGITEVFGRSTETNRVKLLSQNHAFLVNYLGEAQILRFKFEPFEKKVLCKFSSEKFVRNIFSIPLSRKEEAEDTERMALALQSFDLPIPLDVERVIASFI
jgi:hypothetical protein